MADDRCLICGMPLPEGTEGEYHAACAKGLFGNEKVPSFAYSMTELNELAKRLVLSHVSVPGVQAKLSVHLERSGESPDRLTLVGLDGNYILKLPTASYRELFGLVRLESGALAYITRRMDREDGVKHMIDFCQLTNRPSERKYYGSYEQICKGIRACSSDVGSDVMRFFEVLLFSFITGNSDMHLKNFSLLREHDGTWHLSPAYDLVPVKTVLPADKDDLALTVNGKNRKLRESDFKVAAATMGLTSVQYRRLTERMVAAVREHLDEAIARSFLSDGFVDRLRKLVAHTLSALALDRPEK